MTLSQIELAVGTNGVHSIAIPRHKEIAEGTAKAILKEARTYGQENSHDF